MIKGEKYIYYKVPRGLNNLVIDVWRNTRGTTGGFSSASNPQVVISFCKEIYSMNNHDILNTLDIIHELDLGWHDGQEYRTPDEPYPGKRDPKDDKSVDPLPTEEYINIDEIAEDSIDLISDPIIAALNEIHWMNGRSLGEFLDDIGLRPNDFIKYEEMDEICIDLCGRPHRATPEYFSSLAVMESSRVMLSKIIENGKR